MSQNTDLVERWGNSLRGVSLRARDEYLMEACRGRRVLHLGCADSPFSVERIRDGSSLHPKLQKVASSIVGMDIDAHSLHAMREIYPLDDFATYDVESSECGEYLANARFDVVVCADIIEHLNNPGLMLENINKCLEPGGRLIVTTINGLAFKGFLRAMVSREAVHPDHVAYYSFSTLAHLLARFGFKVERERRITFLYPFKSSALSYLQPLFYKLFPNTADGILEVAVRV